MERFTAGWFENLLLQEWIPAMPRVREALERGVDVADVGCNRGRALIKLARAFPRSRFVGYDVFEPALSHGGAGLGTVGLPESKLKELATEAKFGSVRRVPLQNPFNNLYEVIA